MFAGLMSRWTMPFDVCGFECVRDFDSDGENLFQIDRSAMHQVLQRLAVKALHHDEQVPIVLTDFVNRADIGMIQG